MKTREELTKDIETMTTLDEAERRWAKEDRDLAAYYGRVPEDLQKAAGRRDALASAERHEALAAEYEAAAEEAIYRKVSRQYHIEDAKAQLWSYLDWHGYDPEECMPLFDCEYLACVFEDCYDCDIAENDMWPCIFDNYINDQGIKLPKEDPDDEPAQDIHTDDESYSVEGHGFIRTDVTPAAIRYESLCNSWIDVVVQVNPEDRALAMDTMSVAIAQWNEDDHGECYGDFILNALLDAGIENYRAFFIRDDYDLLDGDELDRAEADWIALLDELKPESVNAADLDEQD